MKESIVFTATSQRIGTRAYQQDRCYAGVDETGHNAIGIVCDGMGGMEAGEQASQLALELFVEDYDNFIADWTQRSQDPPDHYQFFRDEMIRIDKAVSELERKDGQKLNTGSTLVAAAIYEGKAYWVSVGDSKIYVVRKNEIVSIVREHNYLMVLNHRLQNGQISIDEYNKEVPYGAGLISYIGIGNISLIDSNPEPFQLMDHDLLILASDGLSNALPQDRILSIIQENPDNPGHIQKRLQDEAGFASERSQDNTTIVTMLYREI